VARLPSSRNRGVVVKSSANLGADARPSKLGPYPGVTVRARHPFIFLIILKACHVADPHSICYSTAATLTSGSIARACRDCMHKRALLQVTHACPALHRTRLRLRVQSASTQAQPLKPLVVCIGWLGAKRRYLAK